MTIEASLESACAELDRLMGHRTSEGDSMHADIERVMAGTQAFGRMVKAVWDAIIAAIRKVGSWITKFFDWLFSGTTFPPHNVAGGEYKKKSPKTKGKVGGDMGARDKADAKAIPKAAAVGKKAGSNVLDEVTAKKVQEVNTEEKVRAKDTTETVSKAGSAGQDTSASEPNKEKSEPRDAVAVAITEIKLYKSLTDKYKQQLGVLATSYPATEDDINRMNTAEAERTLKAAINTRAIEGLSKLFASVRQADIAATKFLAEFKKKGSFSSDDEDEVLGGLVEHQELLQTALTEELPAIFRMHEATHVQGNAYDTELLMAKKRIRLLYHDDGTVDVMRVTTHASEPTSLFIQSKGQIAWKAKSFDVLMAKTEKSVKDAWKLVGGFRDEAVKMVNGGWKNNKKTTVVAEMSKLRRMYLTINKVLLLFIKEFLIIISRANNALTIYSKMTEEILTDVLGATD